MAAALLTIAPSLLSPVSWRRRPLLAARTPALRPRALASPPLTPPLARTSQAARAARAVALERGGGEAIAEEQGQAPPDWTRLVLGALLGSAALLGCGAALAAEDSIRASGFGLWVAASLRRLGWPVLELRGAIPAGYWMRLHPVRLTVLSVLGFVFATPAFAIALSRMYPRGVR